MDIVSIRNLKKYFGKGDNQVKALDGIDLSIEKGKFTAIIGASGSGKTTLLNMIGALEPMDSGKITVNGLDITRRQNRRTYLRREVGFLFQNFALVDNKTVRENLNFIKNDCRSDLFPEIALERVGLLDKIDQKVYSLSGGEQQRAALARLMIKRCSLVLADEPTGSLDRANAERVFSLLETLQQMGKTVIMATHDESFLQKGKRVIKL